MDSSEIVTLIVAVTLVALVLWDVMFAIRMGGQAKEVRKRLEDPAKDRLRFTGNAFADKAAGIRIGRGGHVEHVWDPVGAEVAHKSVETAVTAVNLAIRQDLAFLSEEQQKEIQDLAFNAAKAALGAPFTWIFHGEGEEEALTKEYREV